MNQTISISLPHHLPPEEARRRIETGIADVRKQFAGKLARIDEQWAGNRLNFRLSVMGQGVAGTLDIEPHVVRIEVTLPWLLAAIAEKVKAQVQQQGTKLLEKK